MGADGGSIAKRSEIVVRSSLGTESSEAKDKHNHLWSRCALSGELLSDPIVSDWGGHLYNKKAILEFLLGSKFPTVPKTQIRQIRDVAEITRELSDGRWIDPINRKDIALESLSQSLAQIVECGHVGPYDVLSRARAGCCLVCEQAYDDVVIMNPRLAEAQAKNKQRIEKLEQLGLSHSLRPRSKRSKKRPQEGDEGEALVAHKKR